MSQYDYMLAGRWRNHINIRPVMDAMRAAGKKVYCFIENAYEDDKHGELIDVRASDANPMMEKLETLPDWQTNPTFRKIYENDMNGIRDADSFVVVFPAGASAHMELGAAFGMGKKCYAIGEPEKHETLYLMLEKIYPTLTDFVKDQLEPAV
jgi:hypothetical protein